MSFMATKKYYTLYHSHYSLPSIIARFCISMRGTATDGDEYVFEECVIDIFAGEQLSVLFQQGGDVMQDVRCPNPRQEVQELSKQIPALRDETSGQIVTGPWNICRHLNGTFPDLVPGEKSEEIGQYIEKLQDLDWFGLSLPMPNSSIHQGDRSCTSRTSFQEQCKQRLQRDCSAWYRAALMYRLNTIASDDEEIARIYRIREDLKRLLESIQEQLSHRSESPWLFELDQPSTLDAHLVLYLARLDDAGNEELIPPRLKRYLNDARKSRSWKEVMENRSTLR